MKRFLLFIIFAYWCFELFAQTENLEITQALKHPREVKLSEIATRQSFVQLEYVPALELETNLFCYLLEDRIVCVGKGIYVFDRNGKLLDHIKLPNKEWWRNYLEYCKVTLLNEKERSVVIPLDIYGEYSREYLRDYKIDDLSLYSRLSPIEKQKRAWYLGDLSTGEMLFKNEYFAPNDSIAFYLCSNNAVQHTIVNRNRFYQQQTTLSLRAGSYRYDGELYFYEDGSDFISYVTNDGVEQHVYQLGTAELTVDNSLYLKAVHHTIKHGNRRVVDAVLKKYISSLFFVESPSLLLFSFSYENGDYLGYYSKKEHRTVIAQLTDNKYSSFKDDLSGKCPLRTTRWHVNRNNELCTLLSPEDSERLWEEPFSWKSLFPFFFEKEKQGRVVMILDLKSM